jgi:hypothetical protein
MAPVYSRLDRSWARYLVVWAFWTLFGLIDAGQMLYFRQSMGKPVPFWSAMAVGFCDWYIWAALTPAIFWLARTHQLGFRTWANLTTHALASLGCSLVVMILSVPIIQAIPNATMTPDPIPSAELFHRLFAGKLLYYLLVYWVVVGIYHAQIYYRRYQERELRASQLETQLVQAQLQMLKMQLHPHFLFNTLHAISALLHKDVNLADRMIARLGELLRTALDNAGTQEVPLWQELDFIQPYLEIEQARLGSRLTLFWDIDPETMDAQVPNLLLQPLVENAIRHGIAPRTLPGRIEVRARRQESKLVLQIIDSGPGISSSLVAGLRKGVGLTNTRARLQHLYGDNHSFTMSNGQRGGLVVTLTIPFHELTPAPDDAAVLEPPRHAFVAETAAS